MRLHLDVTYDGYAFAAVFSDQDGNELGRGRALSAVAAMRLAIVALAPSADDERLFSEQIRQFGV